MIQGHLRDSKVQYGISLVAHKQQTIYLLQRQKVKLKLFILLHFPMKLIHDRNKKT